MYNITLISTVHKEIGKCNSNELYKIIEFINPDVIFLEALKDDCLSKYERLISSEFGICKERLELKSIQKYSTNHNFKYVPVLDVELSNDLDTKIKIVSKNTKYQQLIDNYTFLERIGGFQFLNSGKSIILQEEMRELENYICRNKTLKQKVKVGIEEYENSMICNIY